jgi:hypothetical protein
MLLLRHDLLMVSWVEKKILKVTKKKMEMFLSIYLENLNVANVYIQLFIDKRSY